MWQIVLRPSTWGIRGMICFYLCVIGLFCAQLIKMQWSWAIVIVISVGGITFMHNYRYYASLAGQLVIIHGKQQIYWQRRRWSVYKSPLFCQYAVVLDLQAQRHAERQILCIFSDQLSYAEWRMLCYLLHVFFKPTQNNDKSNRIMTQSDEGG